MSTRTKLATVAAATALLLSVIAAAQTVQTHRVMERKLEQSQGLLAALVTSNWVSLEDRARTLVALTNDPGWQVLNAPEYVSHTQAFRRAAQSMVDAASRHDQDAALRAHDALVGSCVRCHGYVARARIASLPLP